MSALIKVEKINTVSYYRVAINGSFYIVQDSVDCKGDLKTIVLTETMSKVTPVEEHLVKAVFFNEVVNT